MELTPTLTFRRWLARLGLAALVAIVFSGVVTPFTPQPSRSAGGDAAAAAAKRTSRVARTALLVGFLGSYLIQSRRRRPTLTAALGLTPVSRPARWYLIGFAGGVIPLIALNALLLALGARRLDVDPTLVAILFKAGKFFVMGFGLALLEETLFRGLVLGDLLDCLGGWRAVAVGSALFAATHFLRTPNDWVPTQGPLLVGFETVGVLFAGLLDLVDGWRDLVGLFLVGLVLSVLFVRAGQVWLGMGVHAGWYWVSQIDESFVDVVKSVSRSNRLLYGGGVYYNGLIGWAALALTLLLIPRRINASKPA